MDPITLHFNVFGQASAGPGLEGRTTMRVEDPRGMTVGALKKQLFPEAFEEQKSIRFIARGHILDDRTLVGHCGLGCEAHIHVSIGERSEKSPGGPSPGGSSTARHGSGAMGASAAGGGGASRPAAAAAGVPAAQRAEEEQDVCGLSIVHVLGAVVFAGAGLLLRAAWRKRWYLSMHVSQLCCISAACWVYLLAFHVLPTAFRLAGCGLRAVGRPCAGGAASAAGGSEMASSTTEAAPRPFGCTHGPQLGGGCGCELAQECAAAPPGISRGPAPPPAAPLAGGLGCPPVTAAAAPL